MAHITLARLREQFDTRKSNGYGWLESKNSHDKTLLLIHGVTGSKNDMLPLAVEYEKQGYHVYCLDLPGHGDTEWPGGTDFERLAVWLREFIELIGEPDVLFSNSFSSAVVYAYLQRGYLPANTHVILGCPTPEISRLSNSVYKIGKALPLETGWYLYTTWVANGVRTSFAARKLERTSIRWLVESERSKRPTIHPRAGMTLSNLLFVENPYQGPLLPKSTQEQMTVIVGARDNVVTKRTRKNLQELLPYAKHITANRAGHILHFEAVEQILPIDISAMK
jgi:pimeloyl-ACP methyl ester carboxylesterase